eukprot:Phypoly_transcript_22667.p1 GENE.Phypoly_transcript_22667~~Phypoly_transcript_22667.p1  ORF type:complete len:163 (+),score=14.14 Phypoly_transcript_22667:39-527(+)
MLKLSSKRSYDSVEGVTTPVGCSPHKIQFLDSPSKRVRTTSPMPSVAPTQKPESPFTPHQQEDPSNILARNAPKHPRMIGSELVFSESEVKAIVEKALIERENALRVEYDSILQELLQEQYRNFAKFHEDYVSRQIKDRYVYHFLCSLVLSLIRCSDFSYMS